jgi:hypothetical protein
MSKLTPPLPKFLRPRPEEERDTGDGAGNGDAKPQGGRPPRIARFELDL